VKILALDIETTPMTTYTWGLWNQNIGINQVEVPSSVMCFAARWVDEPKNRIHFYSEFDYPHDDMIEAAWELVDEADALLTWNGISFDEKHLNREFLLADLGPPSPVQSIDLMAQVKRQFRFDSNKLDWVSQQLGVGQKVGHAGFQLWLDCMANDPTAWRKMETYNKQDVHLLVDLFARLSPWLRLPNQNLFEFLSGCPTPFCKGTPQKRGFRTNQTGTFQRYFCPECRRWSTAGKSIERAELRGI
jgi:hypothetical protein